MLRTHALRWCMMMEPVMMAKNRITLISHTFVLVLLVASCSSCKKQERQEKHEVNHVVVYVCDGISAKRYHSVEDCYGLLRCSGTIHEMTVEEAENIGKTPCRLSIE